MNSIPAGLTPHNPAAPPLALPQVAGSVRAGFPSPADDFLIERLDLNSLVITHPMATFYWEARGTSMVGAGIHDGDILVVNRALTAQHGDVVVAVVDGEYTVKYLHKRGVRVKLLAADPTFPEITFRDGQELRVVGVVTDSIRRHRRRG